MSYGLYVTTSYVRTFHISEFSLFIHDHVGNAEFYEISFCCDPSDLHMSLSATTAVYTAVQVSDCLRWRAFNEVLVDLARCVCLALGLSTQAHNCCEGSRGCRG